LPITVFRQRMVTGRYGRIWSVIFRGKMQEHQSFSILLEEAKESINFDPDEMELPMTVAKEKTIRKQKAISEVDRKMINSAENLPANKQAKDLLNLLRQTKINKRRLPFQ
ncbi:MAG: hypothetical protein Q8P02_00750, partial [Candidatus Micrarchaeota archaeon]|nr:hypothetical protein [Candidatus Micrarchaeota archaeon]